jgi:hypothetical protein
MTSHKKLERPTRLEMAVAEQLLLKDAAAFFSTASIIRFERVHYCICSLNFLCLLHFLLKIRDFHIFP